MMPPSLGMQVGMSPSAWLVELEIHDFLGSEVDSGWQWLACVHILFRSCLNLFRFCLQYLFVGTTDLKAWKIERIYLAFVRLGIGHTCMIQSWVHHWSMLIIDGYWWLLMSSSQCASCSCKTGSYRDCTYLVNAKSWEHWHTQFVLRLPMPYLDGSVMVGG